MHLKKTTANYFVYGELGRHPLLLNRQLKLFKYWLKVIMQKLNRLVYEMYKFQYDKCENSNTRNCRNWAHSVKILLSGLGLYYAWTNQGVGNINNVVSLCKQRLKYQYFSNWNSSLTNTHDGIIYRSFKLHPCYSYYLDKILIPKHKFALIKLITKNNRLPVVSGKLHHRKPYHERLCSECNTLGDEYHFLLQCSILGQNLYTVITGKNLRCLNLHNLSLVLSLKPLDI